MKKVISTFAAVLVAASVTVSAVAATAFHSNYSGTQDIKKGTETVYSIDASYKPEVYTGNAKVATTKYWYSSGNRHFYKLNATGNVGASTGVYAGTKASKSQIFVAKVAAKTSAASSTIKCSASGTIDLSTAHPTVKDSQGLIVTGDGAGSFFFTVEAPAGFTVSTGNSAVGTVSHERGSTYAYNPSSFDGASTGVYVNGIQVFIVKNGNIYTPTYNKSQDEFADELLTLINAARDKTELKEWINGELVSRGTSAPHAEKRADLMKAAAVRAQELSVQYSHTRPSGTLEELVSEFGSSYGVTELIASATNTAGAKASYNMWLASEMHKNGMEDGSNLYYGAAYYDAGGARYFVIVFAGY